MVQDLRYPIGKFAYEGEITRERRDLWIDEIASLPVRLAEALEGLTEERLDSPYRPDGWTVRQVAFHLADSHLNSFARFKLALTEDEPAIKPYEEGRWALLPDSAEAPVAMAQAFVSALHERWAYLLRRMNDAEYARTFFHPASGKTSRLDAALGMYAWHGRHHIAHITSLRERMGWR